VGKPARNGSWYQLLVSVDKKTMFLLKRHFKKTKGKGETDYDTQAL
jgi:hypothetical protein